MSTVVPAALTLLLKHKKLTILLSLIPTTTFVALKRALLSALSTTSFDDVDGEPIPTDPTAVQLALPKSKNDLSKGWNPVGGGEEDEDGETVNGAKGKAKRGGSDEGYGEEATLVEAGVKDGAWVAFKWEGLEWDVQVPSYDEEEDETMGGAE